MRIVISTAMGTALLCTLSMTCFFLNQIALSGLA